MIFVTVGTQLPFDRMVRAVDAWAGANGHTEVFAQIGPTDFRPRHIQWAPFLSAEECREKMARCSAIVAHAGMGSILTALELGKPILVMPRMAEYREHRNDHQLATAKRFLAQGRIRVAFDEEHLAQKLEDICQITAAERISTSASPALLAALRGFVNGVTEPVEPTPAVVPPAVRQPHPVRPVESREAARFIPMLAGSGALD